MTDTENLRNAVLATGKAGPHLVNAVFDFIAPYSRFVEQGHYDLATAIDPAAASSAVALAIGKPVKKLVAVSFAEPIERPAWMTTDAFKTEVVPDIALGCQIWQSLAKGLEGSVGARLSDVIRTKFGAIAWDESYATLRNKFYLGMWYGLRVALRQSLWFTALQPETRATVEGNIHSSLLGMMIAASAGDEERAMKMAPIVRTLSSTVVLGEKADEPGTWLTLIA